MIYYITKYALTKGILKLEGDVAYRGAITTRQHTYPVFFHGEEFHEMRDDAIKKAEEMRIEKLKSLDKQMKKIAALKFE